MRFQAIFRFSLLLCGLLAVQAHGHGFHIGSHQHHQKRIDCNGPIQSLTAITKRMAVEIDALNQQIINQRNDIIAILKVNLKTEVKQIYKLVLEVFGIRETSQAEPKFDEHLQCIENCQQPGDITDVAETGVHLLKCPNSDIPFGAYCLKNKAKGVQTEQSAWLIIQRRLNGAEHFNRTWQDYKNGFGQPDGEYWLGLERMHKLTAVRPYELWIQIRNKKNETADVYYGNFKVYSENENYKLHVADYKNDLSVLNDCWTVENGGPFSTIDRKYPSKYGLNCAAHYKVGWWYTNDCGYCNLNGEHYANNVNHGIFWKPALRNFEIIQYTHMAIRPRI